MKRHNSLILTTHSGADPDGMGAEIVLAQIFRAKGKYVRIVNGAPTPKRYSFMDPDGEIEFWENIKEDIPSKAALVIIDTSDEYNIGPVKEFIPHALEVFVIDHHEPSPFCTFEGYTDNTASSVCEMAVEIASAEGVSLNRKSANAAYTGIIYDSGSFAYSKTTIRTFKAALSLIEAGVIPYDMYHELQETGSISAILLQKLVLSSLQIYNEGRVAVQIMRKEDLKLSDALYEDGEYFINIPLKAKNIEVSVMVKENKEGEIRCSLRSKGKVNVSKIAQSFGGGGHVAAAGFKGRESIEETLEKTLEKIASSLEKT
ncbi:MAG: DHH family phosphoesterase [Treponema sp.]|nr:DHH family phosphoesterase [Treponema sp.]